MGNQAALQFMTILLLSIVLVSLQFGRGIFLTVTRASPLMTLPMHLSELIIRALFNICITVFAVWVVVTQTALFAGISFFNLCIIFSITIVLVLSILANKHFGEFRRSSAIIRDNELQTMVILLLLALFGSTISVLAIRPDLDDVNYTSRAVYFLKHYNELLDFKAYDHGLVDFSLSSPLIIFETMEFFCAYLAFILHLPFLHIYHFFLPALGGAMIPLAWFLVFSKFSKRTIVAALAATAVCVFLSIDGAPHRSFGNFAFVRIWQGKAILMSIVVPLFTAFSLDFFRTPTFSHWNRLFLLLVACAGLSCTASFFMPFLGVLLGFSWWCAQGTRNRGILKKLLTFFSSYAYFLLVVFYCLVNLERTSIDYIGFAGWPETFEGQFKLVFVDFWSYPTIMMVVFTVLSVIVVERSYRRFLIAWIILCVILFLNPIVFPFVSSEATSLAIYWRLFYLLPFPLVIGLPMTFLDRANNLKPGFAYLVFSGLILVSIIGNLSPHKYATFGKIPFVLGQYKIDPKLESEVKKIISVSTPGSMLAPDKYSSIIPRYSPDFPQVSVRRFTLMTHSIEHGKIKEANIKFRAIDYISGSSKPGSSKQGLEDVIFLIRKGLGNIVLDIKVTKQEDWPVFALHLAKNGFRCVEKNRLFLVYSKNEQHRDGESK